MDEDQISKILGGFYRSINMLVMNYSPNQKKDLFKLLGNCILVGGKVIDDKKTWKNDDDIDLYYYEPDSNSRNRNLNRLNNLIPSYIQQTVNLDLLPFLSTDQFKNSEGTTLTQQVFGNEREYYTEQLGAMRMINLYGFFITKLASLHDREEERDYKALMVVMDEFDGQIQEPIQETIKEFGLEECLNKLKEYMTNPQYRYQ